VSTAANKPHSLLISDLHLCAERKDIAHTFVQFCRGRASAADALYVLGDLSDAWLGDDDDGEIATLLRNSLKQLADRGVDVFVMRGNRDFLLGSRFVSDCGCQLLSDPSVIDFYGRQALLMHGDSLCTDDADYMAFREQIQNSTMRCELLARPLEERRQIAASLRAQSRSANASKAEDIMDVNADAVSAALSEHGVSQLIHGHTHRPASHALTLPNGKRGKRHVLGDWDEKGWCIIADSEGFTLESFAILSAK